MTLRHVLPREGGRPAKRPVTAGVRQKTVSSDTKQRRFEPSPSGRQSGPRRRLSLNFVQSAWQPFVTMREFGTWGKQWPKFPPGPSPDKCAAAACRCRRNVMRSAFADPLAARWITDTFRQSEGAHEILQTRCQDDFRAESIPGRRPEFASFEPNRVTFRWLFPAIVATCCGLRGCGRRSMCSAMQGR